MPPPHFNTLSSLSIHQSHSAAGFKSLSLIMPSQERLIRHKVTSVFAAATLSSVYKGFVAAETDRRWKPEPPPLAGNSAVGWRLHGEPGVWKHLRLSKCLPARDSHAAGGASASEQREKLQINRNQENGVPENLMLAARRSRCFTQSSCVSYIKVNKC